MFGRTCQTARSVATQEISSRRFLDLSAPLLSLRDGNSLRKFIQSQALPNVQQLVLPARFSEPKQCLLAILKQFPGLCMIPSQIEELNVKVSEYIHLFPGLKFLNAPGDCLGELLILTKSAGAVANVEELTGKLCSKEEWAGASFHNFRKLKMLRIVVERESASLYDFVDDYCSASVVSDRALVLNVVGKVLLLDLCRIKSSCEKHQVKFGIEIALFNTDDGMLDFVRDDVTVLTLTTGQNEYLEYDDGYDEDFWAVTLDLVINLFHSKLKVSSVLFKNIIKSRSMVLLKAYAEELNESEITVLMTGNYLVGAQQTFFLEDNCQLQEEMPTELKFRCVKPVCGGDTAHEVHQGELRIGDWLAAVNISGIDCLSDSPTSETVFVSALILLSLVLVTALVLWFKRVSCEAPGEHSMFSGFSMRRLCNSAEMHIYDQGALERKQPLKQGFHGTIFEGVLQLGRGNSRIVALKQLKSTENSEHLRAEAEIMTALEHPNIVECIGLSIINRKPEMLIMPFFKNGDLRSFVSRYPPTMSFAVKVFIDIAEGISHLSAMGVVHRDLAARNILLTDALGAKITDFGLASRLENDGSTSLKNIKVAIRWLAIECFKDKRYTAASDIWSFGIVMWEVFSRGMMPYPAIGDDDIIEHILDGHHNEEPYRVPLWLVAVMKTCWNEAPAERPVIDDLLMTLREEQRGDTLGDYSAMALLMDDYETFQEAEIDEDDKQVLYSNIYSNIP
ncbi:Tyrosine-protein kinase transforming protein RYK [Halotydeus destructor]|nr:Tyrosine-protein kinase transforming protein RYK [Halotydeus destructor]